MNVSTWNVRKNVRKTGFFHHLHICCLIPSFSFCFKVVTSGATGGKLYGLPPVKENTDSGPSLSIKNAPLDIDPTIVTL